MSIIKTTTPYEFLARWKNGALAGAHVKFLETITDDGAVVSQREGDPMSVAVAGAAGFPLDDILSALQADAIAERDAAVAAKATAEAALSAATTTHTAALAAKDAAIAALEAQVAELAPPTVNGVPQSVTALQAIQALILRGKIGLVQPAIDAIQDTTQRMLIQAEWDRSKSFNRQRPSLIALATAIGYDSTGLDELFVFANSLP
jgi:hypothetical protein